MVTEALSTLGDRRVEIAFFGGSFTGIPAEEQVELLSSAYAFVKSGQVTGIRLSTRPDYMDETVLERCKSLGVTAIELGAQSMDDAVLRLAGRGHTAECVKQAAEMIRAFGFELGLQMMTGLAGDTAEKARATARALIALRPATVRIYPCLVMEHTRLAEEYRAGRYTPQSLEEAVKLCADLAEMFRSNGITVIRMGLQPSQSLETSLLAGPFHPAFGELVESRILYRKIADYIHSKHPKELIFDVPDTLRSRLVGNKKENIERLKQEFSLPVTVRRSEGQEILLCGTSLIKD